MKIAGGIKALARFSSISIRRHGRGKTVWQSRQIKFSFISLRQGRKENCVCHFYCSILKFSPLCHAASEQRFKRTGRGTGCVCWAFHLGRQTETDERKDRHQALACQNEQSTRFSSSHTHMECARRKVHTHFCCWLLINRVIAMPKHGLSTICQGACGQPQDEFMSFLLYL